MPLVAANDLNAFDVQISRPRVGAWHADMRIDTDTALSGRVTLVIDDGFVTMIGTAMPSRSREFVGTAQLRVVGGNGGLGVSGTPRHYNQTTVGIVLGDLLRTAGETLSPTADQSLLGSALDTWTTTAIPVGALIALLLNAASPGAAWRVLDDGTVWVGVETWPDAGVDATTYQLLDEAAEEGSLLLNTDRPSLRPGTTFLGRRVAAVQDDIPHIASTQTRVWFEDDKPAPLGRLREAFGALARATPATVDYRARYWAKVIAQSGSTIDVQPENPSVPDMGKVLLVGPAGMSADGIVGGRVLVGWSWPELRAYAESFDGGESVAKRVINGAQVFVGAEAGAQSTIMADGFLPALYGILDVVVPAAGSTLPPPDAAALALAYTAFKAGAYQSQRTRVA